MVLKSKAVCSNRELVDQFLTLMSDSLYSSMKLRMERLNPPAGKTSRDPANPYTLEEVMASGLDVLQGVFSAMDRKQDKVRGLDTAASSTRENCMESAQA